MVTKRNSRLLPAAQPLVRVCNRRKRTEDAQGEQAIVNRLKAELKNQLTFRDKALDDAFKLASKRVTCASLCYGGHQYIPAQRLGNVLFQQMSFGELTFCRRIAG